MSVFQFIAALLLHSLIGDHLKLCVSYKFEKKVPPSGPEMRYLLLATGSRGQNSSSKTLLDICLSCRRIKVERKMLPLYEDL